jgi:hypothetical protein
LPSPSISPMATLVGFVPVPVVKSTVGAYALASIIWEPGNVTMKGALEHADNPFVTFVTFIG